MMLAALDRHLHENGTKFSIIKDRHFEESWKILSGKAIELRQQGLSLVQSCSSSDAVIASALFFPLP